MNSFSSLFSGWPVGRWWAHVAILLGLLVLVPGTAQALTPFPDIESISPASGPEGTVVTLTGVDMDLTTEVAFNGASTTTFISKTSTEVKVAVPVGANSGQVNAKASDGSYNGGDVFTFTVTTPRLTDISPATAAAGTSISLTGSMLTGVTAITFSGSSNNTVSSGFTVNADGTQITGIVVPGGAVGGRVRVTSPTGTSNALTFGLPGDLIVRDEQYISGNYGSVIVLDGGSTIFAGPVSVSGNFQVQEGGKALTEGYALSGPGRFELERRAQLFVSSAAGISAGTDMTGDIQVTGGRSYSPEATYIYVGTGPQRTGSGLPSEVFELNSGNDNDVTLSNPVSIRRTLSVYGNGVLRAANGAITLLSDENGTASVNFFRTNYPGVFNVQRYVSGDLTAGPAYRHVSAPVQGAGFSQLTTPGFTPVVNGAYNTSAAPRSKVRPFPTVFGYDEQRLKPAADGGSPATDLATSFDKGWFSPQSLTGTMEVGRGYDVHMPANQTLTFTGPLSTSPVQVGLTRSSDDPDAGWNLVGNPYAASYDMRELPNSSEDIEEISYVYEATGPYAGQYRFFISIFDEFGLGNPYAAMGQAFFVRVRPGASAATLNLAPNATNFGDNTVFHRGRAKNTSNPLLTLSLTSAASKLRDETVLYQHANATDGLDRHYDGAKMLNPSGLNVWQVAAGTKLAVNGLSDRTSAAVVPLAVQVPAAGTYSLRVAQVLNAKAGLTAELVDTQTGQRLNLASLRGQGYTFTATQAQTISGRFYLHLNAAGALAALPGLTAESISVAPNPARGRTTVLVPAVAGASQATFVLRDALGRTVLSSTAALPAAGLRQELNLSRLTAGVYVLQVQAGGSTATRRVVVE